MSLQTIFEKLNPNLKLVPELTIKAIKTYRGHDGIPLLQANLYIYGKKTAFIGDDSRGGEFDVRPSVAGLTWNGLHAILKQLVNDRKFPDTSSWAKEGATVNYTDYICELLGVTEMFMKAKRVRKTTTHIYNPETHEFATVKCPVERLNDAWFKKNLDEGDVVLSRMLD